MAVINEKSAPEILEFREDLITRIEAQIDYQVRVFDCWGPRYHKQWWLCHNAASYTQEEQIELMRGNQDLDILRAIFTTELARVGMRVALAMVFYWCSPENVFIRCPF